MPIMWCSLISIERSRCEKKNSCCWPRANARIFEQLHLSSGTRPRGVFCSFVSQSFVDSSSDGYTGVWWKGKKWKPNFSSTYVTLCRRRGSSICCSSLLLEQTTMGASNSKKEKLPKRDLDFLKSNTQFSEKQIKKWYRGFMEECPSGHLTKDQFIRVYKEFFPCGDADSFCGHVFRTFDTDASGTVDFKEFLLAINVTSNGSASEKLEYAFRMYDIDGSGSIEEREMIKIIEAAAGLNNHWNAIYEMLGTYTSGPNAVEMARKRAQLIFDRLDLNKDHQLTMEEFMKGCLADKEVFNLLTNSAK